VGTGNGEWGMGSGEWGMGNGKWGMGSGEWEVRSFRFSVFSFQFSVVHESAINLSALLSGFNRNLQLATRNSQLVSPRLLFAAPEMDSGLGADGC
jgi:hypothetical protein